MKKSSMVLVLAAAICAVDVGIAQTAPVPDWAIASQIDVQLSNFSFAPAQLALQHGKAYRLHLVNSASKSHNFSAPKLFSTSLVADADRSKVEDGAVEVGPGETVDVELEPLQQGTFEIECTHFMHAMFGMKAKMIVS